MNIENITSLAIQLQELGFGDVSDALLKRVCFRPKTFSFPHVIERGEEKVAFTLFFEKEEVTGNYSLKYFDAVLQPQLALPDTTINGVNVSELDKQMSAIEWKEAFDFNKRKTWSATDSATWVTEKHVEAVMMKLEELEATTEGKRNADTLKLKYWTGSIYQDLFENIVLPKAKSELSQRIYCFEEQTAISVDEACRFLQNRRIEKQLQTTKRAAETDSKTDDENDGFSGNGLLKKRITKTTKAKKK